MTLTRMTKKETMTSTRRKPRSRSSLNLEKPKTRAQAVSGALKAMRTVPRKMTAMTMTNLQLKPSFSQEDLKMKKRMTNQRKR